MQLFCALLSVIGSRRWAAFVRGRVGCLRVGWEGDFSASKMKIKMKFQIQIDFFLFHFHRRVAFAALMEFLSKLLGVLDLMLFYLFLVLLLCKIFFFCAPWMTMWIYILNNPTHSIHNLLHKFTQSSLIPMMMIFLCCCRRRWVEFQIPTLSLTSASSPIRRYIFLIHIFRAYCELRRVASSALLLLLFYDIFQYAMNSGSVLTTSILIEFYVCRKCLPLTFRHFIFLIFSLYIFHAANSQLALDSMEIGEHAMSSLAWPPSRQGEQTNVEHFKYWKICHISSNTFFM